MRRVPVFVWILAPLAVGLLYAAGHALLAPKPQVGNLPPKEAILVHRTRGLDMFDLTSPGPRGPGMQAPREMLGLARNNPGLIGVDHEAWVHLLIMPRTLSLDSSMAIFRLDDADAFEREFMRTDFLERGLIRHAQHLEIRGSYAAVGPSRDATRQMGTGGITCEDLGEDWSMAADLPRLIDHAVGLARQYPWTGVLTALGVQVDAIRMGYDPQEGTPKAFVPSDERLETVRTSWKAARLWAWHTQKRLRVDLEPTPGSAVAQALEALPTADAMRETSADLLPAAPPPPPGVQAWIHMPRGEHTRAAAHLLRACGVRFVEAKDGVDPLGGLGKASTGLLLWAERGIGTGYAMSVGIGAAHADLPALGAFLPLPDAGVASVPLPEGAAPITVGDTTIARKVPAGTVERRSLPNVEILTFGPGAKQAAEGFVSAAAAGTSALPGDPGPAWTTQDAVRPVLRFFLSRRRAQAVLGNALHPGGFLAMLAGGDIHGRVEAADGVVRLTAWVVP